MDGGTYTLLFALTSEETVEVGALGELTLEPGAFAYTGSALGAGGYARVDRHRRLAAGDHDARHWHVDYLLGHPSVDLVDVVTSPGLDAECTVARAIEGESVPGFGCSDCACASHLTHARSVDPLREVVETAHAAARPD